MAYVYPKVNKNKKPNMELLIEFHLEEINPKERMPIIKTIHYDRKHQMFEIEYDTWYPDKSTKTSSFRKTYHEFVNQIITDKKSLDQTIFKMALKRWQRSELLINLWFKTLYDFKPSFVKSKERNLRGKRIVTSKINKDSKFTGGHRNTRIAQDYIKEFPEGIIDFINFEHFTIPVRNKEYVSDVSVRFLNLLKESMGKKAKNYEFDISITLGQKERGFTFHMIKDEDEEPRQELGS